MDKEDTLTEIARKTLSVGTLETRGSDSLDFHDCAAWQIKEALEAAYAAGKEAGKTESDPRVEAMQRSLQTLSAMLLEAVGDDNLAAFIYTWSKNQPPA